MLKVSHGNGTEATSEALFYIAGLKSKVKKQKERIFTSMNLMNKMYAHALCADWEAALVPRLEGQRKIRRTDMRLVMSWKGYANEPKMRQFMDEFNRESGLNEHLGAWACHSQISKATQEPIYHVHFIVNPRNNNTHKVKDIRKGDLKRLKQLYAALSAKYGLDVGYDFDRVEKNRQKNKGKRVTTRIDTNEKTKAKSKNRAKSRWVGRNKKAKAKAAPAAPQGVKR